MTVLISPAPGGVFGLEYGNKTIYPYSRHRPHRGQDWEWRYANPIISQRVVAPAGGQVISVTRDGSYNEGWGNRVEILIPSSTHRIVSALNHLATGAIHTGLGPIGAGDYIGQMGATGEAGGVHLHEELWIDGVRVDPNYYRTHHLPGTTADPSSGGSRPFDPEEPEMNADERAQMQRIEEKLDRVLGVTPVIHQITRRLATAIIELGKVKVLAGNARDAIRDLANRKS